MRARRAEREDKAAIACRLWCHPWWEASLWRSKEAEATEIPRDAETRLSTRGLLFLKY